MAEGPRRAASHPAQGHRFDREGAYVPSLPTRESSRDAQRLRGSLADWSAAMAAVSDLPAMARADIADAIVLARRFVTEVVRAQAVPWDQRALWEPQAVAAEIAERAQDWGLFTLWMPALFGGQGWNFLSLYAFLEEVASSCASVAQLIGAHYMGLSMLTASWNLRLCERVLNEVASSRRHEKPSLISLAILEPATSDALLDIAQAPVGWLSTVAVRQSDGSYILHGGKVDVPNLAAAAWFMVLACEDAQRPAQTLMLLAVPATSLQGPRGPLQAKAGLRACVHGQLLLQGTRVGADAVALGPAHTAAWGLPHEQVMQTLLDSVMACTRTGVGALAAGVARGAWEGAREHAARQWMDGSRLIDLPWARDELAQLAGACASARQAYLEAAVALGMGGLFQMMFVRPMYWADQLMPMWLWRWMSRRVLLTNRATHWFQQRFLMRAPPAWRQLTRGLGARAKTLACEQALRNVHGAMDLMGMEGLHTAAGMDKRLRDVLALMCEQGSHERVGRLALDALDAGVEPPLRAPSAGSTT